MFVHLLARGTSSVHKQSVSDMATRVIRRATQIDVRHLPASGAFRLAWWRWAAVAVMMPILAGMVYVEVLMRGSWRASTTGIIVWSLAVAGCLAVWIAEVLRMLTYRVHVSAEGVVMKWALGTRALLWEDVELLSVAGYTLAVWERGQLRRDKRGRLKGSPRMRLMLGVSRAVTMVAMCLHYQRAASAQGRRPRAGAEAA